MSAHIYERRRPTTIAIIMFNQVIQRGTSRRVFVARTSAASTMRVRAFHSPFALRAPRVPQSPIESSPAHEFPPSNPYQKQTEEFPKPQEEVNGSRTYVVSTPDPANTHYEVPSGAYHSSAPYNNPEATEPPAYEMDSSTGLTPEHPNLTKRVPRNEDGVGESASVR